jgi:UDP-N-acetylmuramyl tripeptide synthase
MEDPASTGTVPGPRRADRPPLRTRIALGAGLCAGRLSRGLGLGEGAVVGGRVTLAVDRAALSRLAAGRRVALVTGTNGKTTTAHLLAAALRTAGPVAHNDTGANMDDGAVAALAAGPSAPVAVLEVDELYLAKVAAQVDPAVVVLLNLTRDQLDRSTEVAAVARAIRGALQDQPRTVVVANCDDPVVVSLADGLPQVQWVAAGANWLGDAVLCPRCGQLLKTAGSDWGCSSCELRRPVPAWRLEEGSAHGPGGVATPLVVGLPGAYNQGNALMAVAAASALDVASDAATGAIARVRSVAHRYAVCQHGAQRLTLLLAKNPAGWRETLPLAREADGVLLAVNAREADGRDTSWLWDVPFEDLPQRPVAAAGEAAPDVALRLAYADLPHQVAGDPVQALRLLPPGDIAVVANYTAFAELWHRLDRENRS